MKHPPHAEPVPDATQLAALPFLAGISGFLSDGTDGLRVTFHRAMSREGKGYLQQMCNYVGPNDKAARTGVGRFWHVNYGIIGRAYEKASISRTKRYENEAALVDELRDDMQRVGDSGPIKQLSWLAIPFLGASGVPTLILFADSFAFNFFADDDKIRQITKMCAGFCRLIDALEEDPFPHLRNFPLQAGAMVEGPPTVYPTVQEELIGWPVPRFAKLESFNFDAA